jgi:hypothetical protein
VAPVEMAMPPSGAVEPRRLVLASAVAEMVEPSLLAVLAAPATRRFGAAAACRGALRTPLAVRSEAVRTTAATCSLFAAVAATPAAVSTPAATPFETGSTATAARWTESATAARALPTRATGRPGEAAGDDWMAVTTGVAACETTATGAGTPATGPFACAGPADQAARAQAAIASAKMLPRHGRAQFALVNIRRPRFPQTGE